MITVGVVALSSLAAVVFMANSLEGAEKFGKFAAVEIRYFTKITRRRDEREENNLQLRGIAPSREAKL